MFTVERIQELLKVPASNAGGKKNKKKEKAVTRLEKLKYYDFPSAARQYAANNYEVFKDTLSVSMAGKDEKLPLAYLLAQEILDHHIVYAANAMQRLFITQPKATKFVAMDFRRFSVFIAQVCHNNQSLDAVVTEEVKRAVFSRLVNDPTLQILPEFFDNQDRYINVANGVVDLKKGKLLPHDAAKFGFLTVIPFNFDENYAKGNKMPKIFKKMLERSFPDKNDRKRFMEFMAYLISNDCSLKVALFLCGKPDTGKSTLMRLITLLVGEENVSNVPLAKYSDRFALATTFGKKVNMAGETKMTPFKNLDNFKAAVGYDRLDAELKGQDHFFFIKKAKDLFLSNNPPLLSRECAEEAVYRRFEFLDLQNPVKRKKQKPHFEKTLMRKHGDKILSIIIREMREFYRNNLQFTKSKASKALMAEFRKDAKLDDSVHAFFKNCCIEKSGCEVSVHDICTTYEKYCKNNGYEKLSNPLFLRLLLKEGAFERCKLHPSRNLQYRAIRGLALKLT